MTYYSVALAKPPILEFLDATRYIAGLITKTNKVGQQLFEWRGARGATLIGGFQWTLGWRAAAPENP